MPGQISYRILVLVIMLIGSGCDRQKDCNVEIVLPANYRGFFLVQFGILNGVEITKKGDEIVFVIPDTGVIAIKEREWAKSLLQFRASTSDGKKLPIATMTDVPDEQVAVWILYCEHNSFGFFVGTPKEKEKCRPNQSGNYDIGKVKKE